jgi:hypothetical protein
MDADMVAINKPSRLRTDLTGHGRRPRYDLSWLISAQRTPGYAGLMKGFIGRCRAVSRCSLVAVAAAGLLLPQGFSRCCPQPGYRSGCDQR